MREYPESQLVGDFRSDNFKRVASAVGEGSIIILFVRKVLLE